MAHIKSRVTAAAVSSLGLVVGLAGIAGATSGSITDTGPNSGNWVTSSAHQYTHVTNHNDADLKNNNPQIAWTGSAHSSDSTTAGRATSGNASNSGTTNVSASVTNSMPSGSSSSSSNSGSGTINHTGPHSTNGVHSSSTTVTRVYNDNDVDVTNNNLQVAVSGEASSSHNTTGGGATSGNASNTSNNTVSLKFSN